MSEPTKSQSERLVAERRRHARAIEMLREECAPGVEADREYQDHMRRIDSIIGPDEETIVDGRRTL